MPAGLNTGLIRPRWTGSVEMITESMGAIFKKKKKSVRMCNPAQPKVNTWLVVLTQLRVLMCTSRYNFATSLDKVSIFQCLVQLDVGAGRASSSHAEGPA